MQPGHSSPKGRCRLLRFGSGSAAGTRPRRLAAGDASGSTGIQAPGPFPDGPVWEQERNAVWSATRQIRGDEKPWADLAQCQGGAWLIHAHFGDPPWGPSWGCLPGAANKPLWHYLFCKYLLNTSLGLDRKSFPCRRELPIRHFSKCPGLQRQ